MELDKLDKGDLLVVINAMKEGIEFEDAINKVVPSGLKALADNIHSLFCKSNHDGDGECSYYREDITGESHLKVFKFISNIKEEFSDIEDTETIISDVIPYLWRVENIRFEVEKEVAFGGSKLFDYLLIRLLS